MSSLRKVNLANNKGEVIYTGTIRQTNPFTLPKVIVVRSEWGNPLSELNLFIHLDLIDSEIPLYVEVKFIGTLEELKLCQT